MAVNIIKAYKAVGGGVFSKGTLRTLPLILLTVSSPFREIRDGYLFMDSTKIFR